MRATVIVLGDIGRSPRMQYHALALAARGVEVDLVGEGGTPPHREIVSHPRIACHLLRPPSLRRRAGRRLFVPAAALDVMVGASRLLGTLRRVVRGADVVLVQTPPALPTLAVALLAARTSRTRLVIDWHNLGYTLLALRLGRAHPVVRAAGWWERRLGRAADAHLAVSHALARELDRHWGLRPVTVLHDQPDARFVPCAPEERTAVRRRLCERLAVPVAAPGLAVTSTSWTDDEDFGLLLEALPACDRMLTAPLLLLVTGEGARRREFEGRVEALSLRRIHVRTAWFPSDEYPRVLGAADVGLSLHRSSSRLDLPMKVADMFGAGLPVVALDYGPCLTELIAPGDTGLLFSTADGLATALSEVFARSPGEAPLLDRLRTNVAARPRVTWEEEWTKQAWPVLRGG